MVNIKKCRISSKVYEALQEPDIMNQNDLLHFLSFSPR